MKTRMTKQLAAFCLTATLAGCLVYVPRTVEPARGNAEMLVSAEQLSRRLDDGRTVVLHVGRDRASYDAGHVPGARFLALSDIVTERAGVPIELPSVDALDRAFEAAGVSDDSRVVLYGDLGGLAAARAFFTLDYLGHTPALLDGGLEAWRAANRPVSTEASSGGRGTFTPAVRPELLVDADWVRAHLNDSTVALVDARPPAEFTGETPGEGVTRPGHITGARNVFWRNTVISEADPRLRSAQVNRALFSVAGAVHPQEAAFYGREAERRAKRDRALLSDSARKAQSRQPRNTAAPRGSTVVTYCRTGVQASYLYFVARYLGYDAKMYDGSFVDWSRRGADYPVER
jgi:thiosulfate/3-mercaptopyruvate sulfurtransferase